MTIFRHPKRRPFAVTLILVLSVALTACVIETQDPVFSRHDIVKVDAKKAAKMGFTPIEGKKTYFYRDIEDKTQTCPEVGFVPLDDQHRLYIAANFSKTCMEAKGGHFYLLADFEAGTLKPIAQNDKDIEPVRNLAAEHGIRLLYDKKEYRYVAVGKVSKEQMKAFFRALAASKYARTPDK